jgi:hypothetical protein
LCFEERGLIVFLEEESCIVNSMLKGGLWNVRRRRIFRCVRARTSPVRERVFAVTVLPIT